MKKVAVFMMLVSLVIVSSAEETDIAAKACTDAKLDAQEDIDAKLWIGAGCLFGLLGVGAAYIIKPSPPMSRLLGKSPDYVAVYTACYKDEGKKIQVKSAVKGCMLGMLVNIALSWLVFFWER